MIYFDSDYAKVLAAEIFSASKSVDVCMYVWRFYANDPQAYVQQVYTALLRATARGVRVRVLTHFPDVAARMRKDGINAIVVPATRTLHAKMFILDGRIVGLGSHNMTKRSTERNHESSTMIDDPQAVANAEQYFNTLWGMYAKGGTNL